MSSMRIIALPLARVGKSKSPNYRNNLLTFYYFDLISPYAGRKDLPWHKKVLKHVTNKAVGFWKNLGKSPKSSWKLWTYELGERVADKIEFEELALKSVDPSLGPAVLTRSSSKQVICFENDWNQAHPLLKIPLIFPPSSYPAEAALAHLQALLTSRAPRHRRGFYLWMLIAPLTVPIILIPLIPNLPLFFCVWRSWSHYRAYRSSQYLLSLLDRGLIEPDPSLELDKLYTSLGRSSKISGGVIPSTLELSSPETPTLVDVAADKKSEAAPETGPPRSHILLTCEAIPQILEMFRIPKSTTIDIRRAMNQVHARLASPKNR